MSSILNSFIYQSSYQILALILPLVTVPYVSRILGSNNVGIFSYTSTIAYYFSVLAMLGIEQYGNRCIAQAKNTKNGLKNVFSELLAIHLLFSVAVLFIYYVFISFFAHEFRLLYYVQGLYIFSSVFDINWFFWGLENFRITVLRNLIIKLFSIVLIFIFVKKSDDLLIYALILSASTFLSQIVLWFYLPGFSITKKHFLNSFQHFKPLLVLFIAIAGAHVYRMVDKVMLGAFGFFDDLGCYEYADKIIRLPLAFITAFGTIMLSRISSMIVSRKNDEINTLLYYSSVFVVFTSFAIAFGLASISDNFIVLFLGNDYHGAIILLTLLSFSFPLVAWNNFVRTHILIPKKKDKIYTIAVCSGAAINFFLNLLLIPHFKAVGATIATFVSYSLVLLIQTYPAVTSTGFIKPLSRHIPVALIIGLSIYFLNRCLACIFETSICTVFIQIVSGVILFFTMVFVYFLIADRVIISFLLAKIKTIVP